MHVKTGYELKLVSTPVGLPEMTLITHSRPTDTISFPVSFPISALAPILHYFRDSPANLKIAIFAHCSNSRVDVR